MHDLVIIGGSAAGISAAVYAARRKLDFILISEDIGGEVAQSGEIANYPGITKTDGIEMASKYREQLEYNDVTPVTGTRVQSIEHNSDGTFTIKAKQSGKETELQAQTVIVATGVHPRHLDIPGEEEFRGKGVTYCTTCDGPLFRQKKVATIGGGNSALESALMLSEIASHVTIINIHDEFKGEKVLMEKVRQAKNIEIIFNAQTLRIEGEMLVNKIIYLDRQNDQEKELETQGVFVHIGLAPNSGIVPVEVQKNRFNEIEVNRKTETNIPGLYAAGDVTDVPYKQIVIASGQGAVAALSAIEYINKLKQ